jgi:hypothetical protein
MLAAMIVASYVCYEVPKHNAVANKWEYTESGCLDTCGHGSIKKWFCSNFPCDFEAEEIEVAVGGEDEG